MLLCALLSLPLSDLPDPQGGAVPGFVATILTFPLLKGKIMAMSEEGAGTITRPLAFSMYIHACERLLRRF